ncbi:MAG: hypothetical protein ABSG78_06035 [Verrucomicrobiota bacterium]
MSKPDDDTGTNRGEMPSDEFSSPKKKAVILRLRSKPKGISLRVMKVKEKKFVKEQVPFDPILFAVTVPSRQPTMKDRADAKERPDDAIEPKDHPTLDAAVKDL